MAPQFTEAPPGQFLVTYAVAGDMSPALQDPLIRALEAAAAKGPTTIVFEVDKQIRTVDLSVPSFWLEQTARQELRLSAMAIVTTSAAVRVAVSGFAMANRVRGLPLQVKAHPTRDEAQKWVGEILTSTATGAGA